MLATFSQVLWEEKGEYYDHTLYPINQQFLDVYLLEADMPLELFEGKSVDAKVPYARVNVTTDTSFEAKINHMVGGVGVPNRTTVPSGSTCR